MIAMNDNNHHSVCLRMQRVRHFTMTVVFSFGLLTGCISMTPTHGGTRLDPAFISSIRKGRTNASAIRAKLGPPQSVITQSSGSESWTYAGWEGKPATFGDGYDRARSSTLILTIRKGVVVEYTFTRSDSGTR